MNNFITAWDTNAEYFEALKILASLSGLFADSTIPYLDYRLAENVFCRYFNAENEARSCTAYDAKINAIGIGIKTFILKNNQSTEKIAELIGNIYNEQGKKYEKEEFGDLGTILDYQTPLKGVRSDKAGKVDLVSYNSNKNEIYF